MVTRARNGSADDEPGDDASTLPPAGRSTAGFPSADAGARLALVVIWSRDEPGRIGEILLPPAGDAGPWTFGRGAPAGTGDERRLSLFRQRPGLLQPTPPLACRRISRAQLRLSVVPGGAPSLQVENIGSCPMVLGGHEVARARLIPGDVLALANELLFLCVRRRAMAAPPRTAATDPAPAAHPFGAADAFGIVGESPAAWELRHQIAAIARRPFHVLVQGESGSGKELVARGIHALSDRRQRPLVSRNAATIPDGLADAELFGNVRNYPNAGMPERPGLIGQAHESTLFLDEFAELPRALQTHLLRVMDEGEYQRLGEATMRTADLRVVAATNRPETHIKHDVLARLKLRIAVPGLDARREDIPLLLVHLARRHAADDPLLAERFFHDGDARGLPRLSPAFVESLVTYEYTGHVRELDALLLRAILESPGRSLDVALGGRRDPARADGAAIAIATDARSTTDTAPASTAAPASAVPQGLTGEEHARLVLLRRNRLSATACGRDPAYPGNRQTADFHLRHLVCRTLALGGWDVRRAATMLAGPGDSELRAKAIARARTFIANLRVRLDREPEAELRRDLAEEWRAGADAILAVLDAIRAGQIVDAPATDSDTE